MTVSSRGGRRRSRARVESNGRRWMSARPAGPAPAASRQFSYRLSGKAGVEIEADLGVLPLGEHKPEARARDWQRPDPILSLARRARVGPSLARRACVGSPQLPWVGRPSRGRPSSPCCSASGSYRVPARVGWAGRSS
jgi:hypothetical protein